MVRVICIGDSITYGQNVRFDEAWPAVLAAMTGWDVRNAGVCGDTTRLGLERFPKHVQLHRPDYVIVQFGHNDVNCWETDNGLPRVSKLAYAANIAEMFERSHACGAIPFVLQPHETPGKDFAYNERLLDYWEELVTVTSMASRIRAPDVSILDDGYDVHADRRMHQRYAALVAAAVGAFARMAV